MYVKWLCASFVLLIAGIAQADARSTATRRRRYPLTATPRRRAEHVGKPPAMNARLRENLPARQQGQALHTPCREVVESHGGWNKPLARYACPTAITARRNIAQVVDDASDAFEDIRRKFLERPARSPHCERTRR
jgi:hypothetical protein